MTNQSTTRQTWPLRDFAAQALTGLIAARWCVLEKSAEFERAACVCTGCIQYCGHHDESPRTPAHFD